MIDIFTESQITPRLIYQANLPKSLEIEEDYYSPIFGIINMFWQIFILRNDNQITELYSRSFVMPPDSGYRYAIRKSSLENGGAIFDNIEYN
ncbi:hypothetical protein C1646_759742 [Rhizophagus diaphanus]|nr:hypothetical protein C1646_759742 [Rhizophagus diaphanus] [Rhizophagus sp. MUCL 43196]